jgi:hypothetical protein
MYMKKITILFYSVMVLLMQSCLEEKMPSGGQFASSPYFLKLNRASVTLASDANSAGSIYVSAKNTPWEITGAPYWLRVSPKKGNTDAVVTFTAYEHMDANSTRTAVLTFQSTTEEYTFSRSINITQQRASAPAARVLPASQVADDAHAMYFGWESAHNKLHMAHATEWSAAVSDEWITLSQYSGVGGESLVISVQDNCGEGERTGSVTIATGEQVLRVAVVQQGQYVDISSTAGDVAAEGGCIELSVGKSSAAGVSVGYHGDSSGWVAVEDDGEGNYTLHVAGNPSAGSRTAQLVIMPVKGGAGTACTSGFKFNITQSGV